MARRTRIAVGFLVAMTLVAPGAPGLAGTETTPEVSDIEGDANFVNSNGVGSEISVGTSPASLGSADLRAFWLETTYDKVIATVDGVRHVHYEPKALVLKVKTTAPARPAPGPSVIFRLPALIGVSCSVFFELWIKGSAPGAVDRDYAALNRLSSCPGGSTPLTAGISLSGSENILTATYPFDMTAGAISNGSTIGPSTRAHVRVVLGAGAAYCCTAPTIDEAPLGTSFVVGSDVPADVNCSEQPAHQDCA